MSRTQYDIETTDDGLIEVLTDRSAIVDSEAGAISSQLVSTDGLTTTYLLLPAIFLIVTLFGGLRFSSLDNSFIFMPPPLVCLLLAAAATIQFVRAGLIGLTGWFDGRSGGIRNVANTLILLTVFTATTQAYNSLLPESGLAMWVIGFCLVWSAWTGLFSDADAKKLLKSTGAVFALAFVVKYLILANLTAPEGGSWLQRMIHDPGKEAITWLIDLPRYSALTGYVQFAALAAYLLGLFLTPSKPTMRQ